MQWRRKLLNINGRAEVGFCKHMGGGNICLAYTHQKYWFQCLSSVIQLQTCSPAITWNFELLVDTCENVLVRHAVAIKYCSYSAAIKKFAKNPRAPMKPILCIVVHQYLEIILHFYRIWKCVAWKCATNSIEYTTTNVLFIKLARPDQQALRKHWYRPRGLWSRMTKIVQI